MNNWVNLMTEQEFAENVIDMLVERKTKASKTRLLNDEIRHWDELLNFCLDQINKYDEAWYLGERYSVYNLNRVQSYIDILNDMALQIRYGVLNTVKQ